MIHVSVPDSTLVSGQDGKKYVGYNIDCNGAYHATVRYSCLLRLHDALTDEWGESRLPEFPPKKIRRILNTKQLDERKNALNRYLQIVAQNPTAQCHPIVLKFFLDAQISSYNCPEDKASLEILFGDLTSQTFTIPIAACTTDVTNLVCSILGVSKDNWSKFALFVVRKTENKSITVVRWLKDFESPYIALQLLNQKSTVKHYIMIRKCTFESSHENEMLDDKPAVRLLYSQASGDVSFGFCSPSADVLQRLKTFQKDKSYREYIKLCQLQKRYGYMHLNPCTCDYPIPQIRVDLAAGNRSLILSYPCPKTGDATESVFRVTRIRGWKLINQDGCLVFTFEYLLSKNHFEWITLQSEQSVILSQCLQAMANDILNSRGANQHIYHNPEPDVAGPSTVTSNGYSSHNNNNNVNDGHKYQSLPEVFSSQSVVNGRLSSRSVGNGAFDLITDDDL